MITSYGFDVAIWCISLLLAVLAGTYLVYRLWSETSRRKNSPERQSKNLRLLSISAGAGFTIIIATLLSQAPLLFLINEERKTYDDFKIWEDVFGESLYINGLIGPSFVSELRQHFKASPHIKEIYITSFGGLVDQALEAAELIEKKGNITVIAKDMCDSACVIVLMSGKTRLADENMKLGFHAPRPIIELPRTLLAFSKIGHEANQYLIRKGIPPDLLESSGEQIYNQLKMVPVTRLAELGIIDGLHENKLIKHTCRL